MKRYFIYGMGKEGIRTFTFLKNKGISVYSFIDSSITKQQLMIESTPCISLDAYKEIEKDDDIVVISIKDVAVYEQVKKDLIYGVYYKELIGAATCMIEPITEMDVLKELYIRIQRKYKDEDSLY